MVGDNIKAARLRLGVSQAGMARVLHVSQQTIASWEVNRTEPSAAMLRSISTYLGVTIDYLLDNEPSEAKSESENPLAGIAYALASGGQSLTPEDEQDIITFIEFLKSRKARELAALSKPDKRANQNADEEQ